MCILHINVVAKWCNTNFSNSRWFLRWHFTNKGVEWPNKDNMPTPCLCFWLPKKNSGLCKHSYAWNSQLVVVVSSKNKNPLIACKYKVSVTIIDVFLHGQSLLLYRQCRSEVLNAVDNYAILCLDVVWCYLQLQSIRDLPNAGLPLSFGFSTEIHHFYPIQHVLFIRRRIAEEMWKMFEEKLRGKPRTTCLLDGEIIKWSLFLAHDFLIRFL